MNNLESRSFDIAIPETLYLTRRPQAIQASRSSEPARLMQTIDETSPPRPLTAFNTL